MAVRLEIVECAETTQSLEGHAPALPGSPVLGFGLVVMAACMAAGVYLLLGHAETIGAFLQQLWT